MPGNMLRDIKRGALQVADHAARALADHVPGRVAEPAAAGSTTDRTNDDSERRPAARHEGEEAAMATTTEKTSPEAMAAQREAAASKGTQGNGSGSKQAAKSAKKSTERAGAKPAAAKKPASEPKYPDNIRAAVKVAKDLRGGLYFAGPKQHVEVRDAVTAQLKKEQKEPTPESLLAASGFSTVKALEAVARGEGDRTATKPLRGLAKIMPDDAWTKGRHLASILAAWIAELKS